MIVNYNVQSSVEPNPVDVNVDTTYINTGIKPIKTEEFEGWLIEKQEQMPNWEYIGRLSAKVESLLKE